MKKALLILLVLLASTGILSAHDGSIGITLAPESFWITGAAGQATAENSGYTTFHLMAEGANYFGDEHSFGIEYGIGALFLLNNWSAGRTEAISDAPLGFLFYAGPAYRYEFSDFIGISAGLGIRGLTISDKYSSGNAEVSFTVFNLDMYGRAAVDFTFLEYIRVNAGLMLGGPVYNNISLSENILGTSSEQSLNLSGFFLRPFIGVSYAY